MIIRQIVKMKKIFISAILGFFLVVSLVSAQGFYYEIDLNYDNGLFSYNDIKIVDSQIPVEDTGGYTAKLISHNGEALGEINFVLPIETIHDTIDSEGNPIGYLETKNKTNFTIMVPYHEDTAYIGIYNFYDNLELTMDVSYYSKSMPVKTKATEERFKFEEIEFEKGIEKELFNYKFVIAVFIFIIILFVIVFLRKRKSS